MTHKIIRSIEYDYIQIPVGAVVEQIENWREHERFKYIAMFKDPKGMICPLFFDEVEEIK